MNNIRMENTNDIVLNKNQWKVEAEAVINDVKNHVKSIELSKTLESTNQGVYLNLTTLEGLDFCVELSSLGFAIVDNKRDSASNRGEKYFETPYSLLEHVSPRYTESFGTLLFDKLRNLEGQ